MEGELKNKKRNKGNASPAAIDETEIIPVITNTRRKTPKQLKVSKKFKASRTPKTVATPLPPLNPANTGNICPIIAVTPAKI